MADHYGSTLKAALSPGHESQDWDTLRWVMINIYGRLSSDVVDPKYTLAFDIDGRGVSKGLIQLSDVRAPPRPHPPRPAFPSSAPSS